MRIARRSVRYVWATTTLLWMLLSELVQANIGDYLTRTQIALERRDETHANRLMRDLFANYNKDVRPVFNYSDTVNITMHLWFKQVLKVDEIDQILTIYCWTEEFWNDQFLRWDPQDYGGLTVIHLPIDKVWRPDILVYNNADMNVRENELSTNAVLNYTGGVLLFRAVITKITCNLDMTYFPFDKQVCSMMFASWSYDGGKVTIKPKGTKNNLEYYIENTEWKLENFGFKANEKYYDCCPEPYYDVTYSFVLERNPSYYILNLIIPSVFITIVTMVGFFTPYSSTGENTEKGGRKLCQHVVRCRMNGGLEYHDTCNHVESVDMPSTLLLPGNHNRSVRKRGGLKESNFRLSSSSSDESTDSCLSAPMASSLRRIIVTLDRIDDKLDKERLQRTIEKEWEQLARVIERVLMILFIFGTVLFALYMLQSTEHQLLNID
uniref:Neurotransmitter-gated ion-channel ligand-binding domain-containing protein n=1 Tax=Plectus sambesii TaxID=2011161 RepID=A0A914VJZ7_9BILA